MVAVHPQNDRILYRAFGDASAHADDQYRVYRELYSNLPEISNDVEVEDERSFDYCKRRKYFVLCAPYTKRQDMLVEVLFSHQRLTRNLLGGSVRSDRMETFVDAAERLSKHSMPDIELGEIDPIAFLRNNFTFQGQKCQHLGVAFVARIRNADPEALLDSALHSRGQLIPADDTSVPFGLLHNDRVAALARDYINGTDFGSVPEDEVAANKKYASRYKWHAKWMKPFLRWLGKHRGEYSLEQFDAKILETMRAGECGRVLDVACGENDFVLKLAGLPDVNLTVGNDVSWSQIQLMAKQFGAENQRNQKSLVLFTNHDARRLPFADGSFDFVLCKNVLHHMGDLDSVKKLVDEVARVGQRAVIVEIMDPKYEGLWGKCRHTYYMRFLHDAGSHFLSREEFAEATKMPGRTKQFEMATVRGVYQFAVFTAKSKEENRSGTEPV